MNLFEQFDGGGEETVFRDVIFLGLAGFVAIVVMLLPHLAVPGDQAAKDTLPPGQVIVEARWPDDLDADVDLWVQAPGDVPVGYSNKGGGVFNLLRDDLGNHIDATKMNYEVSYARGIVPGEYTVNLHLYRNPSKTLPIPVTIVVSVKGDASKSAKQILVSKPKLARTGQELTVFSFKLAEAGKLVAGSVHSLQRPLRAVRKS